MTRNEFAKSDLSPRMSIDDVGYSLSSLGFESKPTAWLDQTANATATVTAKTTTTTTTAAMTTMISPRNGATVLTLREEDIRVLTDSLGDVLEGADETLRGLEADRELLPSAILRRCHELADGLASLADELEGQSAEERSQLADAIRHDLWLYEQNGNDNDNSYGSEHNGHDHDGEKAHPGSMLVRNDKDMQNRKSDSDNDSDDILRALSGASTLLRDVETAFREIGNEEAEEIADAALIMARLFLLSLQSIHSNLLQNFGNNDGNTDGGDGGWDPSSPTKGPSTTVFIEELSDSDEETLGGIDPAEPLPDVPSGRKHDALSHARNNPKRTSRGHHHRVRVLWPPLGPGVDAAMEWTRAEASKRPFLAVALGLTLWPVAVSTALLGTSVSLLDGAVQETYDRFQNGPWIVALEKGAAQAYQAGRLTVATGKLVGRQSLRVAAKQIERRGGIGPIAGGLRDLAVDRITHPIDTLGKVWDGVHWSLGKVRDATDEFWSERRERHQSIV